MRYPIRPIAWLFPWLWPFLLIATGAWLLTRWISWVVIHLVVTVVLVTDVWPLLYRPWWQTALLFTLWAAHFGLWLWVLCVRASRREDRRRQAVYAGAGFATVPPASLVQR